MGSAVWFYKTKAWHECRNRCFLSQHGVCERRLENTGLFCDSCTVRESILDQVLVGAINQTLCEKDDFLTIFHNNIVHCKKLYRKSKDKYSFN